MKLNKSLLTLLTTVTLTTLLGAAPITVKASNYSSNVTANQKKHYVIKNTPKLSKWGYVLNVNSSALPIFVGKSNYQKLLNNPYFKGTKSVSPKRLKNVRFKIVKIMVFKDVNGTPEYLLLLKIISIILGLQMRDCNIMIYIANIYKGL